MYQPPRPTQSGYSFVGRSGEYWRLLQPGPRLGRSSVLYVAVTHASILACLLKALTANCAPLWSLTPQAPPVPVIMSFVRVRVKVRVKVRVRVRVRVPVE